MALTELQREYERARHELGGAVCQGAINLIVMALPEVGVLGGIGVVTTQIALDHVLGPEKEGWKHKGQAAAHGLDEFPQIPERFLSAKAALREITAKRIVTTGAHTTGTLFDVDEISAAYAQRNALRARASAARGAYEQARCEVDRVAPQIEQLRMAMKQWERDVKDKKLNAEGLRKSLLNERRKCGYTGGGPLQWNTVRVVLRGGESVPEVPGPPARLRSA